MAKSCCTTNFPRSCPPRSALPPRIPRTWRARPPGRRSPDRASWSEFWAREVPARAVRVENRWVPWLPELPEGSALVCSAVWQVPSSAPRSPARCLMVLRASARSSVPWQKGLGESVAGAGEQFSAAGEGFADQAGGAFGDFLGGAGGSFGSDTGLTDFEF